MHELDYAYHYANYARIIGVGNDESELYVQHKAQEMHILHVHDVLRDEQVKSIALTQSLKEPQAQYFTRFGVGRRVGMLWSALRSIKEIVAVGRTDPLSSDDVKTVSRDLNTIYINIVGTIDNYAWCLLHECGSTSVKALQPNRVGLFAPVFIQDACFAALRAALEQYKVWFIELRSRRDPAAHRIPLSVPPSHLTPEEGRRYQAIDKEIGETIPKADFARVNQLWEEQEKLGVFVPKFLHHPEEPLVPFYPTIPQDLAYLLRVSATVREFLAGLQ